MVTVPTLAEVAQDRSRLVGLPFQAVWALLFEASALQTEIAASLGPAVSRMSAPVPEDRLLTFEQAAERLNIAPATAQKWFRREPYNAAVVVRSRTMVRVSAQRLDDILLSRGPRARRKAG